MHFCVYGATPMYRVTVLQSTREIRIRAIAELLQTVWHNAAFHQGIHCLPKDPSVGIQYETG